MLTDVRNGYLRPLAFDLQQERADITIAAMQRAVAAPHAARRDPIRLVGNRDCGMLMITMMVMMAMRMARSVSVTMTNARPMMVMVLRR
jgi:hypothetical protein